MAFPSYANVMSGLIGVAEQGKKGTEVIKGG